eukprot:scaffold3401_cov109-Isochrysis_galbana.AAC.1
MKLCRNLPKLWRRCGQLARPDATNSARRLRVPPPEALVGRCHAAVGACALELGLLVVRPPALSLVGRWRSRAVPRPVGRFASRGAGRAAAMWACERHRLPIRDERGAAEG